MYIPLLPAALVEVLSTPTPFIAGIHASVRSQVLDLLDVIIVDCDSGHVKIPECVHIPIIPEPMNTRLLDSLSLVSCLLFDVYVILARLDQNACDHCSIAVNALTLIPLESFS